MGIRACVLGICTICFVVLCLQAVMGPRWAVQEQADTAHHSHDSGKRKLGSWRAGSSSETGQQLLAWLEDQGTLVHVHVAYAGPGRGHVVLAKQDMAQGDILAAIPIDVCWIFDQHGANGSVDVAAANLALELPDPQSPWRAYWDALPTAEELLCPLVSLPTAYLPLLNSQPLEDYIKNFQARVHGFWEHIIKLSPQPISLEQFKYARSLLITRMFGLHQAGNALVPLLDLANHEPGCLNRHSEQPCPQDPSRQCLVWKAGSALAAGAEVCNGYKYMPNDKSFLQYGYLQDGAVAEHLHVLDYSAFNSTNFWLLYEDSDSLRGPPPFTGTSKQCKTEADRLIQLVSRLSAADAAFVSTPAAAADKGGRMLNMLRQWHGQRKAAAQKEISRLLICTKST